MRGMKRPLWLVVAVIGVTVFGLLSMIHGVMVMMTPDVLLINYMFGIVGITLGVLDLVAAYTMWKTGRPWFIMVLFGPLVTVFGSRLEIELDWLLIMMFLTIVLFVAVFLVFMIVTSRRAREDYKD